MGPVSSTAPLAKADFSDIFDSIPDGTLEYNELKHSGKLNLLFESLLKTTNNNVVDYYAGRMDFPLYQHIRDRLQKIVDDPASKPLLAAGDIQRIKGWLGDSFSDRSYYAGISFNYNRKVNRSRTVDEIVDDNGETSIQTADRYSLEKSYRLKTWLGGNLRPPQWRLSASTNFSFEPTDSRETVDLQASTPNEETTEEDFLFETTPKSFSFRPSATARRTDNSFVLSVNGDVQRVRDPLPDDTEKSDGIGASFSSNNPFGFPIVLDSTFDWSQWQDSPPAIESDNHRRGSQAGTSAELTYQLGDRLSLIGNYAFSDSDTVSRFSESESRSHDSSLLTQIRFGESLRLQAGGGFASGYGVSARNNIEETVDFDDKDIDFIGRLFWNFANGWRSSSYLVGSAVYRMGTLTGWYPYYSLREQIGYSQEDFGIDFEAAYSGFNRDMYYRNVSGNPVLGMDGEVHQVQHQVSGTISAEYTVNEWLEVNANTEYSQGRLDGFRPRSWHDWSADGSFNFQIARTPLNVSAWLGGGGGLGSDQDHYFPGSDSEYDYYFFYSGLSASR